MVTLTKTLNLISLTVKGLTDRIKFKSISRESLTAQVEDTKHQLTSIDGTIFSLNKDVLEKAYDHALTKAKADKDTRKALGRSGVKILADLHSGLRKPTSKFGKGVFGPMVYTNKILIKCMRDIHKDINNIIGSDKGFVLGETKISQGIFLGVLEASKMYSRYNMYMIAMISHINSGTISNMPRYMLAFLENNSANYVQLVNSLCAASGRYSVINDITNIKSNGLDLQLYVDEKNNAAMQSRLISDVLGVENVFVTLFNIAMVPIALIGESYIDARHSYYMDMNERKKWLEVHIANLRIDSTDEDPNSAEAIQTEKAIQYYEDKIAKMDKKLDVYYNN